MRKFVHYVLLFVCFFCLETQLLQGNDVGTKIQLIKNEKRKKKNKIKQDRQFRDNNEMTGRNYSEINSPPKIYDCFTFFNELELLEIRLNELDDVVDYFVLVEMDQTFQGTSKLMIFKENKQRFEKFLSKIIHIEVTDRIEFHNNPWEREKFQRDQILRALHQCKDNDVILVSDLDEIISHQAIPRIVEGLKQHPIVACHLDFFVYFLNAKEKNNGRIRPFAIQYGNLKNQSVDDLRKCFIFHIPNPPPYEPYTIHDAGWHFCSMGGLTRFVQKLDAWSHTPENTPTITPEWRTQTFIDDSVKYSCDIIEIDATFPQFVVDHLNEYRQAGFVCERPQ